MSLTARRFAATAVDYALAAGWAGTVLLMVLVVIDPPSAPTPASGQLLGFVVLTVPVTVTLAFTDARGGSPGKRLVGLRLRALGGGQPSPVQSLMRTIGRIGLPWELAHAAVWRLADGTTDRTTIGLIAGAYLLPFAAAMAVLGGRTAWYDLLARTAVCPATNAGTP